MKMDDLVQRYIEIRNKKAEIKAEYEANVGKYDAALDKIEAVLLQKFNELGVDSVKTSSGTAYVSVRTQATLADWDAYRAFLSKQEDPYMFVERRVSKAAVEQYKTAHEELPPGVNWVETRTVNFRRT